MAGRFVEPARNYVQVRFRVGFKELVELMFFFFMVRGVFVRVSVGVSRKRKKNKETGKLNGLFLDYSWTFIIWYFPVKVLFPEKGAGICDQDSSSFAWGTTCDNTC